MQYNTANMKKKSAISICGIGGRCGDLDVFMGIAPAGLLYSLSFADVLDEDTGKGYQRPRNTAHSRSFSKYIAQPRSSTIPLTFNLRGAPGKEWRIALRSGNSETRPGTLEIAADAKPLAQVDCQHRLGELKDSCVPLAFMTFIGLQLQEEMALFNIINSRARGLSSSLTDYHESNLLSDLANEAPHLFIARRLNEDPTSPWYRLIRYGGESTSGLKRRTSLRMMQQAVRRFLKGVEGVHTGDISEKYQLVCDYWRAVGTVFPDAWNDHRHYLLAKGVGLYSLMYLLGDIVRAHPVACLDMNALVRILMPLHSSVDWSSSGMFANAGGHKGAVEVYRAIKGLVTL